MFALNHFRRAVQLQPRAFSRLIFLSFLVQGQPQSSEAREEEEGQRHIEVADDLAMSWYLHTTSDQIVVAGMACE